MIASVYALFSSFSFNVESKSVNGNLNRLGNDSDLNNFKKNSISEAEQYFFN